MSILPPEEMRAEIAVPVLIIGAGACGLTAALAARDAGRDVLLLERDRTPSGSTSMSSGFIPAAATCFQRDIGEDDTEELFVADILAKSHDGADPHEAKRVAHAVGPALEWLAADHAIPFHVLQGFRYPGHSRLRMHAVPERTGAALEARLLAAAEAAGAELMTGAHVTDLFVDAARRVHGVRMTRPDGSTEDVGCDTLILACNGYGGNPDLVRQHIPELADALFYGHVGNQGDALRWGEALGAVARDLSACQGHGGIAPGYNVQITWALLMEGGIQVNLRGERFWNEHEGYSEAATAVLRQPESVAWNIYDARLHALGMDFEDYRQGNEAGAIRSAPDAAALAHATGLPEANLGETITAVQELAAREATDTFGRDFTAPPLAPPYYAVRVTGALLHTQGGLLVDDQARVLHADGSALPNLFAGGGAARGVSGPHLAGYLSGNGLLTAIAYGALAGRAAAGLVG